MDAKDVKAGVEAVIAGLTPLAEKLAVPVEGLFKWGMRHNYAEAITDLIVPVIVAVSLWPYLKFVKWGLEPYREEPYREHFSRFDDNFGLATTSVIGGVMLVILTLSL